MTEIKKAILTVKETNNKAGRYHYQVVEIETGNIITERKSNRQYVAATHDGQNYFGSVTLAQKYLRSNPQRTIAYLEKPAQ